MPDAGKIGKISMIGSVLSLTVIVLVVISFAYALIYFINNTDILEDAVGVMIVIIFVIVIITIIARVVMTIMSALLHSDKGETYRTNASYKLEDIESVKEKDSEKENNSADGLYRGS